MGGIVSSVLEPFTGAKATRNAANTAAEQQAAAARQAAQVASFRPVGMTTRFGSSAFDITDVGGVPRVTGASYEVSPELQAIQNQLMGLAGGSLGFAQQAQDAAAPLGGAAQGLFNLGQQYMAESPEALRQRYFNQQQALLAQPRAEEEQRLASSVFGRGRAGLNVGAMGQPELAALAGARRQQDLALAASAEQAAQQQLGFGSSLFGTGASLLGQQYGIQGQSLAPIQSLLGTVGTIEELGQQPFNLGMSVGAGAQPGASAGASLLGSGLTQAANTRYQGVQQANAANAAFLQSAMQAASGGFGGFGGSTGLSAGGWLSPYDASAGVNFTARNVYG